MKKENLNSAPWTEKEKAELARLWLMQIPVRIIAEQLQRSPSAVVSGAWRLQLPRQDEVSLHQHLLRSCLKCQKSFCSQGKHNRICDPCRAHPTRSMLDHVFVA
ncbi:MAG: hypothetical protein CML57_09395 [Rhodobacteraceae bacterium]|nr:hypothetical protein [Paracoccaceae bacterium]